MLLRILDGPPVHPNNVRPAVLFMRKTPPPRRASLDEVKIAREGEIALSANLTETPALLGITVGRRR